MKVSFRHAYESLIKLTNKETNKVCFLFSCHFARVKQLVDFFERHSNHSTKRVSLSELANMISPDGVNIPFGAKEKVLCFVNQQKPEYIILEDNGDLPQSFLLLDDLCNIIREIGEKVAVVVVSENAGKISLVYGEAERVDVPGLNERSLKIRPSSLQTEELYLRNQCDAIRSGFFWANNDIYEGLIKNKMTGDLLFAKGKYKEAFKKYSSAISFHSKHDKEECLIHDFIGVSLYLRCVACFVYGKWTERSDANKYMKESIDKILTRLKRSSMADLHRKMLSEYDLTFKGLRDAWLSEINFLLFLNEYIF